MASASWRGALRLILGETEGRHSDSHLAVRSHDEQLQRIAHAMVAGRRHADNPVGLHKNVPHSGRGVAFEARAAGAYGSGTKRWDDLVSEHFGESRR